MSRRQLHQTSYIRRPIGGQGSATMASNLTGTTLRMPGLAQNIIQLIAILIHGITDPNSRDF